MADIESVGTGAKPDLSRTNLVEARNGFSKILIFRLPNAVFPALVRYEFKVEARLKKWLARSLWERAFFCAHGLFNLVYLKIIPPTVVTLRGYYLLVALSVQPREFCLGCTDNSEKV